MEVPQTQEIVRHVPRVEVQEVVREVVRVEVQTVDREAPRRFQRSALAKLPHETSQNCCNAPVFQGGQGGRRGGASGGQHTLASWRLPRVARG